MKVKVFYNEFPGSIAYLKNKERIDLKPKCRSEKVSEFERL